MTTAIQEAIDRALANKEYPAKWEEHADELLLANEVKRLQDLHRPRDTRKGEWPVIDEYVHMWSGYEWMSRLGCDVQSPHYFWLPAPPSPED